MNAERIIVFLSLVATGACSGGGPVVTPECRRSLAEAAGFCPATFQGDLQEFPACSAYGNLKVHACADGAVVMFPNGGGFGETRCAYDSTSHALIGVYQSTDTNSLCKGTSLSIVAGTIPSQSCTLAQERVCPPPDAGS